MRGGSHPTIDPVVRFWMKVQIPVSDDLTLCWEWTGAYNTPSKRFPYRTRRPHMRLTKTRVVYAARFILAVMDGVPLSQRQGQEVCHLCSNPKCVRPDHLAWGSRAENVRDRYPHKAEAAAHAS